MDMGAFIESLEHKTIFRTGSTGFLAKIFLEKVLRVQPHVKKIFVLLRAGDNASACQRFENEVIGKDLFRVLREKYGNGFRPFILNKVTSIDGGISLENLGIKDPTLTAEIWREVNFFVNAAATTKFDERYDLALSINVLGAKHVCDFAKKCSNLEMLLHVSTAYVGKENEGLNLERPLQNSEIFYNDYVLDIGIELKLAKQRLEELNSKNRKQLMRQSNSP